jgi:hypothetical protein
LSSEKEEGEEFTAYVRKEGRITLPNEVRDALAIVEGFNPNNLSILNASRHRLLGHFLLISEKSTQTCLGQLFDLLFKV